MKKGERIDPYMFATKLFIMGSFFVFGLVVCLFIAASIAETCGSFIIGFLVVGALVIALRFLLRFFSGTD